MRVIIQGSNNPLVITLDEDVSDIPVIIVTLWSNGTEPVRSWNRESMTVDGDKLICPITEDETAGLANAVTVDVKAWDENGQTVFWDEVMVNVKNRKDRNIRALRTGG